MRRLIFADVSGTLQRAHLWTESAGRRIWRVHSMDKYLELVNRVVYEVSGKSNDKRRLQCVWYFRLVDTAPVMSINA